MALKTQGEIGEIGLVDGAVMCLVYRARPTTRNIDSIFEPASVLRKIASDKDDVIFLTKFLKLKKAAEVFSIIEHYYPKNYIPSKTQFFIEEVISEIQ